MRHSPRKELGDMGRRARVGSLGEFIDEGGLKCIGGLCMGGIADGDWDTGRRLKDMIEKWKQR